MSASTDIVYELFRQAQGERRVIRTCTMCVQCDVVARNFRASSRDIYSGVVCVLREMWRFALGLRVVISPGEVADPDVEYGNIRSKFLDKGG